MIVFFYLSATFPCIVKIFGDFLVELLSSFLVILGSMPMNTMTNEDYYKNTENQYTIDALG